MPLIKLQPPDGGQQLAQGGLPHCRFISYSVQGSAWLPGYSLDISQGRWGLGQVFPAHIDFVQDDIVVHRKGSVQLASRTARLVCLIGLVGPFVTLFLTGLVIRLLPALHPLPAALRGRRA